MLRLLVLALLVVPGCVTAGGVSSARSSAQLSAGELLEGKARLSYLVCGLEDDETDQDQDQDDKVNPSGCQCGGSERSGDGLGPCIYVANGGKCRCGGARDEPDVEELPSGPIEEVPAAPVDVEDQKPHVEDPEPAVSGSPIRSIRWTGANCPWCRKWEATVLPVSPVEFEVLDVVEHADLAARCGITQIPSFSFLDRDTGGVLETLTGYRTEGEISAGLKRAIDQKNRSSGSVSSGAVGSQSSGQVVAPTRMPRFQATPWGTIDMETYRNDRCNCPMCRGIRALQAQYWQSAYVVPAQEPTPDGAIREMLDEMPLSGQDVLCDLGCGDGRILIEAVDRYGCRGIGVEIDPQKADLARRSVKAAGLSGKIEILTGDARKFSPKDHGVTAITAYLYPELLAELVPQFRQVRLVGSPFHRVPGLEMTRHGDVWIYRGTE